MAKIKDLPLEKKRRKIPNMGLKRGNLKKKIKIMHT